MSGKVTPDMLKNKLVFDSKGTKVGLVKDIVREQYRKLNMDFLEIELDKKMPWGPKDIVKVRTSDAHLLSDGNIKVKYSRNQLKTMHQEQELRKHPPTV